MLSRILAIAAIACSAAWAGAAGPSIPGGYGLGFCLEAREKPSPTLCLTLRHHLEPYGWGRMTDYALLPLGEIRVPGSADQRPTLLRSDAASRTYGVGADAAVKVTVSRLTPALLLELEGTSVALFAGDKAGPAHPQYYAEWRKRVPVGVPRAPRSFALSDGRSVRTGALAAEGSSLAGAEKGWALLWHGQDAWFYTGNTMMEPTRVMPGDAPILLVCSQTPTAKLTGDEGAGPEGSLVLTFPQPGARMALLPLAGYRFLPASDTLAWGKALPDAVRERCDGWAARLAEFPVAATETLSYDAATDTATLREAFTYARLRPGGERCAPVPPMLELARQEGFPVAIAGTIADTRLLTYCGPYVVVERADGYTVAIRGLGKYARELGGLRARADGAWVAALQAELVAAVDQILAAGHLAPVNLPWKISFGWGAFAFSSVRHLYSAPGQMLSTLARALPLLDSARQERVRTFLTEERQKFPPELMANLPAEVGARREPWTLSAAFLKAETSKLRDQNFHVRTKTAPVQALYDLACYYAGVGFDKMAQEGFELEGAIARTLRPWTEREDWATLGWLSWPLDKRDPQYYASYGWNQPADANRMAAALIGLARLARAAKSQDGESRAIAQLAKALTHRYAIGKYAGWLYKQKDVLPPPPEGSTPADDPRAASVSDVHAILGYGRNQEGPLPYFSDEEGPYVAMVPELARFFADHLRPEAESFARATALYYPDAFLTLGTPRRCAEWWHSYPQDSHQIFLVQAWVLGRDGDWLRRHLDVPLVPVGDLYYLDKLVAALGAGH